MTMFYELSVLTHLKTGFHMGSIYGSWKVVLSTAGPNILVDCINSFLFEPVFVEDFLGHGE